MVLKIFFSTSVNIYLFFPAWDAQMKEGNSKKTALEEKYKVRMQELSVSLTKNISVQWGQMKLVL